MQQPLIDDYGFGEIIIGGERFRHDVIVTPSRIISDWWRQEGHRLQLQDVRDFLLEKADVVIIGTGYDGMMRVEPEVVDAFKSKGKDVVILKSREAVRKYNDFVMAGRKVMMFIHLTC